MKASQGMGLAALVREDRMYGARGKWSWWEQVTNCKERKWNLCVAQLICTYILKVKGSVLRGSADCQ